MTFGLVRALVRGGEVQGWSGTRAEVKLDRTKRFFGLVATDDRHFGLIPEVRTTGEIIEDDNGSGVVGEADRWLSYLARESLHLDDYTK